MTCQPKFWPDFELGRAPGRTGARSAASRNPACVQSLARISVDKYIIVQRLDLAGNDGDLHMHAIDGVAIERQRSAMVANMARPPKGGDTDQIKAVASGECQVALTNSYYLARLMRSEKSEDRAVMDKVGIVFPNQQTWGTHVNVAGAGVARHAPHRDAAIRFLEYLAGDKAQIYFADGNNEWPAVASVRIANPALQAMGRFKAETIPVSVVGMNQVKIQQMLDRANYK